ncbi:MAG TPA: hypothetical protein VEZ41_09390, partial [Allosphingosinicella sp.]|nr:hypothetical protein [Allosphingosinicella sp.]
YQVYAALRFKNERARLRYSEYCLLSTAIRYSDFDHVKKQMYKVHKPHLESGYLAKVSFEGMTDEAGNPDWWMYYVPGPNASREYWEFTGNVRKAGRVGRGGRREIHAPEDNGSLLLPFQELVPPSAPEEKPKQPERLDALTEAAQPDPETRTLIEALVTADLNRGDAERLVGEKPEECRRQMEYLPYVTEFKTSRGAYLRRAIEQGFAAPVAYRKEQEAQETKRKRQEEAEARRAREAAQEARKREEEAQVDSDIARLEKEAPEAFLAFSAYVEGERRKLDARFASMSDSIVERIRRSFDSPEKQRELFQDWRKNNKVI